MFTKSAIIPETKNDVKSNTTTSCSYKVRDCHKITEVHPNVFLGDEDAFDEGLFRYKIDVAVPLYRMYGSIWKSGWQGDILYVPVSDYGVLPEDIMIDRAVKVKDLVVSGKSVAIFCMGGHGRTGYFAACVLWFLGVHDPIKLIRENYCEFTVESQKQIDQVEWLTGIKGHKPAKIAYYGTSQSAWGNLGYGYYGKGSLLEDVSEPDELTKHEKSLDKEASQYYYCDGVPCQECKYMDICWYGELEKDPNVKGGEKE